jgi:cobalt/nickel transport system ATP-binding protein
MFNGRQDLMIRARDLTVRYRAEEPAALRELGFSLEAGERAALIGANGAGKSPLLLTLMGFLSPETGGVELGGLRVEKKNLEALRRRAGMVFQNPDDQLFMPTVYEDVAFGPRNCPSGEPLERRVEAVLDRLGIARLRERLCYRLSGGEKRLAALAGVLVMDPEILLLDEPSSFLDPRARRIIIGILDALPQTMLIATHDLDLALDLCRRTILLKEGRVFADGPSEKLLTDPVLLESCGLELPLSRQSRSTPIRTGP